MKKIICPRCYNANKQYILKKGEGYYCRKCLSFIGKEANKKYGLTKKELEVLSLIVDGLSNQEISEKLVVSISTTKAHVHNILQKLYVKTRSKAVATAMKDGLV